MTIPDRHERFAAVLSVDEFVFTVPELEPARDFYKSFGLDLRDEEGALALYTFGHPHRWARIVPGGASKRLLWITLGVYAADLERFERQIDEREVPRISAPSGAELGGLWIQGPDGLAIQLKVAEKSSPSTAGPREFPAEPAGVGRAPSRSKAQTTRPLYLSHILLFASDVPAASKFYEDVLGLRVSDSSAPAVAFLHTPHGSDHHLIAFAKGEGVGLHHSSWCVPSIDAIGMGTQQMIQAGYPEGWGIGRHVLGSNYFRYVRDPWGSYAEYSFDIDFIPAGQEWPAADYPPEDSLYVWGTDLPADFITNHEVAAM